MISQQKLNRLNLLLLLFLILSGCNPIASRDIGYNPSKPTVLLEKRQATPLTEESHEEKKERWQDQEIPNAVRVDIAMNALVGAGAGHITEKIICHAMSEEKEEVTITISTSEESKTSDIQSEPDTQGLKEGLIVGGGAITGGGAKLYTLIQSAEGSALVAKVSTVVAANPIAWGAGALLGASVFAYYAWNSYKESHNSKKT